MFAICSITFVSLIYNIEVCDCDCIIQRIFVGFGRISICFTSDNRITSESKIGIWQIPLYFLFKMNLSSLCFSELISFPWRAQSIQLSNHKQKRIPAQSSSKFKYIKQIKIANTISWNVPLLNNMKPHLSKYEVNNIKHNFHLSFADG